MAVDAMLEELALHRFDEMQVDLDPFTAWDGNRIGDKRHAVAVMPRVGADFLNHGRTNAQDAFVKEDNAPMLPVGLLAAEDVDEDRIVGSENAAGEHHRELECDGEVLSMPYELGGRPRRRLIGALFGRSSPHRCLPLPSEGANGRAKKIRESIAFGAKAGKVAMRYVFSVLGVLMLLAAAVQYNDPDGPLWTVYYGVPAIWCGLAALRPEWVASSSGRALLGASVVAALALTIWYWPSVPDFWREPVWRMGLPDPEAARIAEEAREGIGMMIATAVLLIVAGWTFFARGGASDRSGRKSAPA